MKTEELKMQVAVIERATAICLAKKPDVLIELEHEVTVAGKKVKVKQKRLPFHHSPNGGHRHPKTGADMKRCNTLPGWPDLMCIDSGDVIIDGRWCLHAGLAIELKTGKGRQSYNQKQIQRHLEACGFYYAVISDVETAVKMICVYLGVDVRGMM
jgi:hypothetical protein